MATAQASKSAAVRKRLSHPVIDSDGHTVEFEPAFLDYLKQVGGATLVKRYHAGTSGDGPGLLQGLAHWYRQSPQERRDHQTTRPPWWATPTKNTLDLATATLPKLLYERLDEMALTSVSSTRAWAYSCSIWKMKNSAAPVAGL